MNIALAQKSADPQAEVHHGEDRRGRVMPLALGIALVLATFFILASSARGGTFQVGIADPGPSVVPASDVSTLKLGIERRLITWHGESTFTGSIPWTPGVRHFISVFSGYPSPAVVPVSDYQIQQYCGFVLSVMYRYPSVRDVIVWNEPNLQGFWGAGADAYSRLVATCAPQFRNIGARTWAPGISPASVTGIYDFAHRIAAHGAHIIDGWDMHEYQPGRMVERMGAVRAAFGWKIPVLIGEAGNAWGASPASLMQDSYCAGAMGWLNFKFWDDGDWHTTGLIDAIGRRKADWYAFRSEINRIRAGAETCSGPPPVAPPPPTGQPPHVRKAFKSKWKTIWICPQGAPGSKPRTYPKYSGVCVPERVRNR